MTNTDTQPYTFAATLAAEAVTTSLRAQRLDDRDDAFGQLADQLAEKLDATGDYADFAYADLLDAAYDALVNRVAEMLA